MEHDVVPPDLAAALLRAGYRAGGPAGVGAHGPAWTATGLEDGPDPGRRVVVTSLRLPGGRQGQAARSRLDALRAVRHEHLAEIVDVLLLLGTGTAVVAGPAPAPGPEVSRRGTRWAVLLAEVPGPNLAALLAARPPLTEGEAVTLTVPLARALAALHDVGLVHGDVSPANVVVRPDGRPVLIDLLGAVLAESGSGSGSGAGAGTPGFAAPELAAGAPPEASADVFALARVALAAMHDRADAPSLRSVLERACAADPADRPDAAQLGALAYAAAVAAPLAIPDAAVLARTTLARLAIGPGPRSALTARPPGIGRRGVRRGRRRLVRLVAGAVVLAGCAVGAASGWGPLGGTDRGPDRGTELGSDRPADRPADRLADRPGAVAARETPGPVRDPVEAAVELTKARVAVLAAGDGEALSSVDLPGGRAHEADAGLLARLAVDGGRIDGLAVAEVSARSVDRGPDRARVEVTSALTAYRRLSASGSLVADVPAQPARTVLLDLAWTPVGWRVAEVSDPPSDLGS